MTYPDNNRRTRLRRCHSAPFALPPVLDFPAERFLPQQQQQLTMEFVALLALAPPPPHLLSMPCTTTSSVDNLTFCADDFDDMVSRAGVHEFIILEIIDSELNAAKGVRSPLFLRLDRHSLSTGLSTECVRAALNVDSTRVRPPLPETTPCAVRFAARGTSRPTFDVRFPSKPAVVIQTDPRPPRTYASAKGLSSCHTGRGPPNVSTSFPNHLDGNNCRR